MDRGLAPHADYGRSWRVHFWVEVEVTADNLDDAVKEARAVTQNGNYDSEQLILDDVWEVDPRTGRQIEPDYEPPHNGR